MLVPQDVRSEQPRRQGCPGGSLADLRRGLACPSALTDAQRQRLHDLARRVARIRTLGGEYAGLSLSPCGIEALSCRIGTP